MAFFQVDHELHINFLDISENVYENLENIRSA